jgi:predicted aspartyl protease
MISFARTLLMLAAVVSAPVAAQSAAPAPTQTSVPTYEPTTVIDAGVDRSLRMTVPVTVDGQGPYQFVVDTGADRTVVSRELADHLNLAPSGTATMHTMSGVGPVDTVRVSTLEVGGGRNDGFNAPALSREHLGANGLVGVDSLQGRRVVMDFRKGTMSVTNSKIREAVEPDTIVVTAKSRYGQLVLVDSDIGGIPITVIIDSGAQSSVGNLALRRMLEKRNKVRDFLPAVMTDVTGTTINAEVARVESIRLGGFTLTNVGVLFADAHPFKRFDLLKRPAMLLGMDTLRAFRRVSVDFAQRKVRFLLPDGSSDTSRKQWFAFRSPDTKSPL